MHVDLCCVPLICWAACTAFAVGHRLLTGKATIAPVLVLLLGPFVSIAERHYSHDGLGRVGTTAALGSLVGCILGAASALVIGSVRSSVPSGIIADIENAERAINAIGAADLKTYIVSRQCVEELARSAHSLATSTAELRGRSNFFNQGMVSTGWHRLERARLVFEKVGSDLVFSAIYSASQANSPQMAAQWRSIADEERFYAELLNVTLNSLVSRIAFYNGATALVVALTTRFATIVIGLFGVFIGMQQIGPGR